MKTITKLVDPQPHGSISECVSGEFAVVGFDVHHNVIDANITFHGKYVGDTVKFGDRYYIIREARVVAIKNKWWWILDVDEDERGSERLQFEKAWHWLGHAVSLRFNEKFKDINLFMFSREDYEVTLAKHVRRLLKGKDDPFTNIINIALSTVLFYEYEVKEYEAKVTQQ